MQNELDQLSTLMHPELDEEIRTVLGDGTDKPTLFYGMLHYHMGWVDQNLAKADGKRGKRIRPLLCLLTCHAAGGDWRQAIPAAAAIEILHNFTLIHDDIEDASPTRHGRDTVWTVWGSEQAINAGDAMFAIAHLSMGRLAERGVAPETVLYALRRFDETCVELTQGQHADMLFETQSAIGIDEYLSMIEGKTAVLLALCSELGAKIAGASPTKIAHYRSFARQAGLAFQVIDDILGIWGDEIHTGKSAATDILTKKKTLPVLYGLQEDETLRQRYNSTDEPDEAFVQAVIERLNHVGASQFAREKAKTYSESALNQLSLAAPQGNALFELANLLLKRSF